VEVTADGAGAGHGVGFCQWGAIGRARAGFSYGAILSAYFPGTELTRTY
jgi:stage II sporulation protein D